MMKKGKGQNVTSYDKLSTNVTRSYTAKRVRQNGTKLTRSTETFGDLTPSSNTSPRRTPTTFKLLGRLLNWYLVRLFDECLYDFFYTDLLTSTSVLSGPTVRRCAATNRFV